MFYGAALRTELAGTKFFIDKQELEHSHKTHLLNKSGMNKSEAAGRQSTRADLIRESDGVYKN